MTWSKLSFVNLLNELEVLKKYCSPQAIKAGFTKLTSKYYPKNNARGYNNITAAPTKEKLKFSPNIATTGSDGSFPGKVYINTGPVDADALLKPFLFTVAFSSVSFALAVICQYEKIRNCAYKAMKDPEVWFNYQNEKQLVPPNEKQSTRRNLSSWWNNLTDGERVFLPICLANVLVFAAWRVPRFLPVMVKKFCSNPASCAPCWPMFLSTFSHYSPLHLFANMYVLHSFSAVAVSALSPEEFLALYFSSGVIASFCSYAVKAATGKSGLTLGASGAIMGIIGFVCLQYPETKLSIIFLPWIQFSALSAIKAMMALDLTGILMGWRVFDHGAHVGGGLAGIFWCVFGHPSIWQHRESFIKYWVKLRGGCDIAPKK